MMLFLLLKFISRVDAEALTQHRLFVQSLDHLISLKSLLKEKENEGKRTEYE